MIQINFRLLLAFILSSFVLSVAVKVENPPQIDVPEVETAALVKHHIIIGKKFIITKPDTWHGAKVQCKKYGGELWWPRKHKVKFVVDHLKKHGKSYLPIWVKYFGSALHEDGTVKIPKHKKLHGLCLIKKKLVKHKFFLTRKTTYKRARKICLKRKGKLLVPTIFNVKRFSWYLKKKGIFGAWVHGGLVLYKTGEIKYPIKWKYRGICVIKKVIKKKVSPPKAKAAEDEADEDEEEVDEEPQEQEGDEDQEEQEGDQDQEEQGGDEDDEEQGDDGDEEEQGDDGDEEEQGDDGDQDEQEDDESQEEQGDDESQEEQGDEQQEV